VTPAAALVNVALGLAYCGYGVMTALEMRRDWRTFGFSHFGLAWIFMAFTCGPHHLFHGVHLAFEGRPGQTLDVASVLVGLPAGVTWLSLRVEAFTGGRGDRFIAGTPRALSVLPALSLVYITVLIVTVGQQVALHPIHYQSVVAANVALVIEYNAIGWYLLRTQIHTHRSTNGWSLSGITLAAVFPTCAITHAVWAVHAATGRYAFDTHGFVIDWLSVPAAAYFLWVVRGLYRGTRSDWNERPIHVG